MVDCDECGKPCVDKYGTVFIIEVSREPGKKFCLSCHQEKHFTAAQKKRIADQKKGKLTKREDLIALTPEG
jgi:uncharacterized Zn finger protein (UPF0148 family)